MFKRIYIEITNICNLSCSFCPGCNREKRFMTANAFSVLAEKVRRHTNYLCLHVMGEPTAHPQLEEILSVCDTLGFRVILTTNGTLLSERKDLLFSHSCLYKINISLHSKQANDRFSDNYYTDSLDFALRASEQGIITVLRLWNLDGLIPGENKENDAVFALIKDCVSGFWKKNGRGYTVKEKLFLEYDECFVWPNIDTPPFREQGRCRALFDQIAVLVDGTVVPCCLDGEGCIALGNLFDQDLDEILESETVVRMKDGFLRGQIYHPLCKTCGYATRFDKKINASK